MRRYQQTKIDTAELNDYTLTPNIGFMPSFLHVTHVLTEAGIHVGKGKTK